MPEEDIFRICRLCLKSGNWAVDVFNPKGTEGFLVWIIMKELVEIQASRDDGLPHTICNECMKKLSDCKHFKFMCTNSRIEFLKFKINSGLVEHCEILEDDIFRMCRLCLKSGDWAIDVMDPKGTNGLLLWVIMKELVEIQVYQGDGLPHTICNECMKNLSKFKHFKTTCINSRIEFLKLQINSGLVPNGNDGLACPGPSGKSIPELGSNRVNSEPGRNEGSGEAEKLLDICVDSLSLRDPLCLDDVKSEVTVKSEESDEDDVHNKDPCSSEGDQKSESEMSDVSIHGTEVEYSGNEQHGTGGVIREKSQEAVSDRNAVSRFALSPAVEEESDAVSNPEGVSGGTVDSTRQNEPVLRGWGQGRNRSPSGSCLGFGRRKVDEKLICVECGASFVSKRTLAAHIKAHRSRMEDRCDAKGGRGQENSHGTTYPRRNHKEVFGICDLRREGYNCDHCGKGFSRKAKLIAHICCVHLKGCVVEGTAPEKMVRCKNTSRIFAKKSNKKERSFTCECCSKDFVSKKGLMVHINAVHQRLKPYFCNICSKNFTQKKSLKTHVIAVHIGEMRFKCIKCGKRFSQSGYLSRHMKTHDGKKPFECELCHKKFSQSWSLSNHMRTHDGKRPFECEICQKKFSLGGTLSRHMRIHDGKRPFECELCHKRFSETGYLRKHMRTHDGKRPFKCEVCNKTFSQSGHLSRHMRIHDGKKPFECELCNKKFSQSWNLSNHMRTHDGKRPFECELCHKKFSFSWNVSIHMRTHDGKRPFKCEVCNKKFSQRGSLTYHMRTHDGKRPFQCEMCHKKFARSGCLRRHKRTHDGKKPFECKLCHQKMPDSGCLSRHMMIHDGRRPFNCELCQKKFSRSGNLKDHMARHQEGSHEQQQCHKLLETKGDLRKHEERHSSKKTFKCEDCSKTFRSKRTLRIHVKVHDGEGP